MIIVILSYGILRSFKKVVFVFGLGAGDGRKLPGQEIFFFFSIIFSGIRCFSPRENLARN